jgi:hypothetical protein
VLELLWLQDVVQGDDDASEHPGGQGDDGHAGAGGEHDADGSRGAAPFDQFREVESPDDELDGAA